MDGKSLDILSDKFIKLKEIIPEAFTEEKIDWEKLKAALGEDINFENERYNLNWAGKSDAFRVLQQRTSGTLRPVKDESVNFDKTENVFIEGENLEVLKILQKSYFGKIKMIYIDPPYNTGSDSFIYPDKFSETKDEYLKRIGDKDEEGFLLKEGFFRKNSKESGHYHSNWLSMMYPRLYTARNLLREDGVIFVSIDDNEVHNLRMIMNEIFGEENFLGQIVLQSNPRGSQSTKFVGIVHEYIIAYSKDNAILDPLGQNLDDEMKSEYFYEDDDGKKYRLLGLRQRGGAWRREQRPSLFFPIYLNPNTCEISLEPNNEYFIEILPIKPTTNEEGSWRWSKTKIKNNNEFLIAKRILRDGNETWDIYQKDYLENELGEEKKTKTKTIWDEKNINYQNGTLEVKLIFDGKSYFDFPKPVYLVKKLIEISNIQSDDFILDFFAGSGTTAQAVMELNKEDGGNRKFILVQLPEKTDESSEAYKAKYFTIADICKERIRRVISRLTPALSKGEGELFSESKDALSPLGRDGEGLLGFKVFKLAPSNFKMWRSDIIETEDDLNKMVDLFDTQIKPDAKKENMLYELMLKSGFTLTDKVEKVNGYYSVNDGQAVFVLDKIDQNIIDSIIKLKPQSCIILDDLFTGNDQLKTNTALQMKDAGVEMGTV